MKVKDITKRIVVVLLSLVMTITYMPAAVFAEPLPEAAETQTETAAESAEDESAKAEKSIDAKENTDAKDSEQKKESSFAQEEKIDDVVVKVEAEAGVFPDEAELVVEKASKKEAAEAAEAVDEVRSAGLNVAESYTFDIKVLDAEGKELQPVDGKKVNVSFAMDRAADKNLSADIYHITEKEEADKTDKKDAPTLEAEKLDAETDRKEATVEAETDGFSLYAVEFTYNELTYKMENDSEGSQIEATKITQAVGLTGEIENIVVSNNDLFSASKNESDVWIITSHKHFDGEETMTVTIASVEYSIKVTSDDGNIKVSTWSELQNAIDSIADGKTIKLTADITSGGEKTLAVVREGVSFTIDLSGHTINRNLSGKNEDNHGHVFDINKGTVTIVSSAEGGKITGGSDKNGGAFVINEYATLNIEDVTISGNCSTEEGGAIDVFGNGTLSMKDCTISDNTSKSGGGIFIRKNATATLTNVTIQNNDANKWGGGGINNKGNATLNNCTISGNHAGNEGGGIYQGDGTLELKDCKISGNDSPGGGGICSFGTVTATGTNINNNTAEDGGGLAVHGTFNMTGGNISGNKSEDGGGVYNVGGTINFNGVTISGNSTSRYGGGGINNKDGGSATIENCTFIGNSAKSTGGGIYADANITITDCKFENNHSDTCGGAVRMYDCTATITNCTMTGNTANEYGGAIYIDNDGKAVITNGSITGGTAYKGGSGIWVGSKGTLDLSGPANISGNSVADVHLQSGKKINIKGSLSDGDKKAKIGVTLVDQSGIATSGFGENNGDAEPYDYFIPETGCSIVKEGNEAKVIASLWGNIQHMIDTADNGDVISIDRDIKAKSEDHTLTVPAGKEITIDLKGHTLDRALGSYTENGEAFAVNGTLRIKDSVGGGKVTGGYGGGGGVCVNSGGDFTLEGGSISGNIGKLNGGGILVLEGGKATVKHDAGSSEGGKIENNNAPKGGGIYSEGIVVIEKGAVISGNTSSIGGGVYLQSGTATLKGGTIKDNSATDEAGGVWHGADAALNVQGAPTVISNNAPSGKNIVLRNDKTLVITGELTTSGGTGEHAALDLTTVNVNNPLTSGLTEQSTEEAAKTIFTYNNEAYDDALEIRDNELYHKEVTADVWISDWKGLQNAINAASEGQTIGLSNDIKAGSKDDCQFLKGKNVTIELNGHVIDRDLDDDEGDGNVFRLQKHSYLTIIDSVGTGMLTGGYPDGDGGAINIEDGSNCYIRSGIIKGNKASSDGGAINIKNGYLEMTGGTIYGNYAKDTGGAIHCEEDGEFHISNATISNNKAHNDGGAFIVYGKGEITNSSIVDSKSESEDGGAFRMSKGTLTITDTNIDRNWAENEGGGIVIYEGTVTMNGGSISGNYGSDGGGVLNHDGTINFTGVSITGNRAGSDSGGGITNHKTAKLKDCDISNNKSSNDCGGGVYNKDTLEMENCTLNGNDADSKGGAVFNKSKMTLKNCTMENNSADDNGGAIYTKDDDTIIDGGKITGNSAKQGCGIYADAQITIRGAIVVKDNALDDVYLNDEKFKVDGSLEGSTIGVKLDNGTGTFTKGYKDKNLEEHSAYSAVEPYKYFFSDDDYSVVKDGNQEAKLVESEWPQLQQLIVETAREDAEGDDIPVLKLDRDWKASSGDTYLSLPTASSLIIDLNGHTINRNCSSKSEDGHVFKIDQGKTLIIRDTSDAKTGTITGGWADEGGAFYLNEEFYGVPAKLTIEGGNITGNKATSGGAIFASRGNKQGAIANISGGSISGNEAVNGGAIYLSADDFRSKPATVNISGGIISGNNADVEGGAIWAGEIGAVNASGMAFVKGNTAAIGNNILFDQGNKLNVTGELTVGSGNTGSAIDTAAIDLMVKGNAGEKQLTEGLINNTPAGMTQEEYAKAVFTYNEQSYESSNLNIKNSELWQGKINVVVDDWVSDWAALQAYVNSSANNGKTVGLANDIDASNDNYSIKVDGDNINTVTIELNGHKMDRKRSSSTDDGHVINVKDGATLIIKDSIGTGMITGGNTSDDGGGIKIEKKSTCRIEGGTISGNKADPDGGGIFVAGTLEMTGGTISGNSASDTGGGIYCTDNGTFNLKNVIISGNTSENDGGGLIVHLASDATIENCRIVNNTSKTEDGGGMRVECKNKTLNITNSVISGNRADNDGGGMVIYAGKVIMNGGAVSGNTAQDGAGVYNDDGSIDFYNVKIDGNTSTKKGGAGLNNRNNAKLVDCEITNNVSNADGGGIYTTHQMTVEGGRISGNSTADDGGGIYNTDDGTQLINVEISGNKAGNDGGGVFADDDMKILGCKLTSNKAGASGAGICIKDSKVELEDPTIENNSASENGGGIYINNDGKLDINGGDISANVSQQYGGGIHVNSKTDRVSVKGIVYIYENQGVGDVYLAGSEKLDVEGPLYSDEGGTTKHSLIGVMTEKGLEKDFTEGYSGYHEGVDPASIFISNAGHDVYLKDEKEAAFKKSTKEDDPNPFIDPNSQVDKQYNNLTGSNWMSGLSGERYLNEVNMPGTHDSGTKRMHGNATTSIFGSILYGLLGDVGELIYTLLTDDFAECQVRYIDEQLSDGVRRFDLRVNTFYVQNDNRIDNGKDLWIIHGKDKKAGTYYAQDHNGSWLTLDRIFTYYKEFLKENPTETILIEIDSQGIGLDEDAAKERIEKHIRSLAQEINPSTGKPYLYTETGDYTNLTYTRWPQMKECRGQIIYRLDKGTGLDEVIEVAGSFGDDAKTKIKNLTNFYNAYGFESLPTDASKKFNYYLTAGTNGTDEPSNTPLEIAEKVLSVLFDEGGLLTNREGLYIGLVNMDGVTTPIARQVWITNFFDGTEYRTVTAKSGDGDLSPKLSTVLKGTPITIPECIYPDPNEEGDYFQCWKAADKDGNSLGTYYPGDDFTVTDDVTFTAVWEKTDSSVIRAVWIDGNDADGLRPNKLMVQVTTKVPEGSEEQPETKIIILTAENKVWRENLNYEVSEVGPINPIGYTSEVKGTKIILTHAPSKTVRAKGNIEWRDDDNAAGKRPSEITLNLYADDEQIKEIKITADDDWAYDLGDLPLYSFDKEKNTVSKINYTLTETGVDSEYYSTYVSGLIESGEKQGFEIINTLNSSKHLITGYVLWADDDDDAKKRPDKVTLNLNANGEKLDTAEISKDENGDWYFEFDVTGKQIPYGDYSIEVEAIDGYISTVYMGEVAGDIVYIVNKLNDHQHTVSEFTYTIKEPTCEDAGEKLTLEICTTCGTIFKNETEEIPALGHDWGKWNTKKTATEDEYGVEERVCDRDDSHVESRLVPKKSHVHTPVKVDTKAATCTVDGNIAYYYCSECGWYFIDPAHPGTTWIAHGDEVIPATGHDWDEWKVIKEATETEKGEEQRTCKNDGAHKETREIAPKDHEHQLKHVEAKDATCTDDGNIEYWVCEDGDNPCGLYFKDSEGMEQISVKDTVVPATGHDWGKWKTESEATEEEEGLEKRTCNNDPSHTEERNIPKTLHVHDPKFVQKVDSTCTTEGNIAYYYCEGCGWYFIDGAHPGTTWIAHGDEVLSIDPDAHDWGPWKETKAPTDTEEGEEEHTCSRCGETETRVIPKVDPSLVTYRVTEGNEQTWYKGSSDTADFTFKRSVDDKATYSHFTGIKVDGKDVSTGSYTKESGSVIIKLKPKYLKTLNNGKHTITAEFDDGSAKATFKVAEKSDDKDNMSDNGSSGAKTGDSNDILVWLAVTLAAMLALVEMIAVRRRKKN